MYMCVLILLIMYVQGVHHRRMFVCVSLLSEYVDYMFSYKVQYNRRLNADPAQM